MVKSCSTADLEVKHNFDQVQIYIGSPSKAQLHASSATPASLVFAFRVAFAGDAFVYWRPET
jgi:hypothetical protein